MKKLIVLLVSIACLAGVCFLGYTIFSKKNVDKVELEGQIQTLYLANTNEINKPNFQDAKLKVTYKDGNVKYIPLKTADISVTDFSTSLQTTDGKMKITYKSKVINVDYTVIKHGFYYVNSDATYVSGNATVSENYTVSTTKEFFNLEQNGTLKYYQLKDGKWLLYDGKFLSDYKYVMTENRIDVYLGTQEPAYSITATSTNGELYVTASHSEYNNGMETTRVVKNLKYVNNILNPNVESYQLVYNSADYVTDGQAGYFKLYYGQSLSNRRGEVLLKFTYKEALVGSVLKDVYVVADVSMIPVASEFDTQSVTEFNRTANIWYASKKFEFVYRVYAVA